jgi:outer membrane usher protein
MARLHSRQQGRLNTYSLSHSARVGTQGSLNVVFTQVTGASSARLFSVSLLWPLENQINTSLHVMQRNGQTDAYASASQGLRGDTGMGWRVLGGTRNGRALSEGGIHLQGQRHLLTADASVSSGQQSLRLGTQGGFVLMGGRLFASRPLQESFALVDVGMPDVRLNFQGREQARTDAQGQALLTGLQPYNTNSVRLNPSDLPLSAEIDSLEQVVVPRLRSAARLSFPVRSGQAALVTVLLQDGRPAPAGAEIERLGDARRFPVGRGGQAFLTGLLAEQPLRLHWKNASCLMALALPPGSPDDIARPKPLVCEGVSP